MRARQFDPFLLPCVTPGMQDDIKNRGSLRDEVSSARPKGRQSSSRDGDNHSDSLERLMFD